MFAFLVDVLDSQCIQIDDESYDPDHWLDILKVSDQKAYELSLCDLFFNNNEVEIFLYDIRPNVWSE
jgi:hypothetical protein